MKTLYIVIGMLLLMSMFVVAVNESTTAIGYVIQQTWLTQEQVTPVNTNLNTFIAVLLIIVIYKWSQK